jgi:hypothetical protein
MKKILFGCLILIAACQQTTPTSIPESTPTISLQTPTAPAAVPPTLTSTPAFTPTPIPLFFTEEFNSDLGAWTSFLTSGETVPRVFIQSDSLVIDFSRPHTWYYAVHNPHEYSDVHMDAKFDSAGNRPVSLGLMCMYSENEGWFEYNISTDGTYSILLGQWLANGIARYTPIVNDESEYLTPGRTDYEIGITCQPEFLWLSVNGKLFKKINVARYELTGGKVGITAAAFQNVPVTAVFEWFKVSEPIE